MADTIVVRQWQVRQNGLKQLPISGHHPPPTTRYGRVIELAVQIEPDPLSKALNGGPLPLVAVLIDADVQIWFRQSGHGSG